MFHIIYYIWYEKSITRQPLFPGFLALQVGIFLFMPCVRYETMAITTSIGRKTTEDRIEMKHTHLDHLIKMLESTSEHEYENFMENKKYRNNFCGNRSPNVNTQ